MRKNFKGERRGIVLNFIPSARCGFSIVPCEIFLILHLLKKNYEILGGHLGRQPKVWPDPVIFNRVLIPWIVRQANANGT